MQESKQRLNSETTLPEGYKATALEIVPQTWEMLPLRDLAGRTFGGGTPSTKQPEYWDGDIPWTTTAVIGETDTVLRKFQRGITGTGLAQSSTKIAPAGSILIGTRVGLGKCVVTPFDVAINQDVTALVPNSKVLAEYLPLVFKLDYIQGWFRSNQRGTTIKGVSREDVVNLLVPLPPLPEQRIIVAMLSTVQRAKEATEKLIAAGRDLLKALMRHLLMYGPVPLDQADRVPLKETEIGPVPEHWQVVPLGKAATLQRGKDLPEKLRMRGSYPVFGSNGVVGFHEAYIANGPGVLVGRSGSVGEVTWIAGAYWPLNTALWVKDFHDNNPKFIYYLLKRMDFTKYKGGVSVPTLNRNLVHPVRVAIPPLIEQQQIARLLEGLDRKIEAEDQRRNALDLLFKALLHRLMTGQVRVTKLSVVHAQDVANAPGH